MSALFFSGLDEQACGDGLSLAAMSVGDATFGQVIRRKFNRDFIAWQDLDEIFPHLAGQVREDFVSLANLDFERSIGQRVFHRALDSNHIIFRNNYTSW